MDRETIIETCARAAHEARRIFLMAFSSSAMTGQQQWEELELWQRQIARAAVPLCLGGLSPEGQHREWIKAMESAEKFNPGMVPFDSLTPAGRHAIRLWQNVVRSVGYALTNSLPEE